MAKRILVSIHGFRSSSETFNILENTVKKYFDEYVPVDWSAGISDLFPIERMERIELAIADNIEMVSNIAVGIIKNGGLFEFFNNKVNIAKSTSDKINSSIEAGGDVVIVAHSLGTVLLYEVMKRLRRDINIHFISFGGVMNSDAFSELLRKRKNILSGVNFYSPKGDRIINTLYLYFSKNKNPIGTSKVKSKKCINVLTNQGHCGYLNADFFYYYYYYIILILRNKIILKLSGKSELSFDSDLSFSRWIKYGDEDENFNLKSVGISKIAGIVRGKGKRTNALMEVFNMGMLEDIQIDALNTHGGNWSFWSESKDRFNANYNMKGDGWVSNKSLR